MKRRIPMALLVVGVVGFYACSDGPVAVNDVGSPLFQKHGAGGLPSITGGGVGQNFNSGFCTDCVTHGGFSAKATGAGVGGVLPVFGTAVTVYPARGQFQAKSVPAVPLGSLHAKVVCIANLGPSNGVDGGGNAANDVWEMRIQVTKSSSALPVGAHGSIFVQDNGKKNTDFADENFDPSALGSSLCGLTTSFQLEPVLQGSITVR